MKQMILLALGLLVMAGCQSKPQSEAEAKYTLYTEGYNALSLNSTNTLIAGDKFYIMQSVSAIPYTWVYEISDDSASYVDYQTFDLDSSKGKAGAPVLGVWRFSTRRAGNAVVTFYLQSIVEPYDRIATNQYLMIVQ